MLISEGRTSALHCAVSEGSVDCMELLLDYQADINAVDIEGKTPLHIAIARCQFRCIRVLLRRGARVDVSSDHVILAAIFVSYIIVILIVAMLLSFLLIIALPLFSVCFFTYALVLSLSHVILSLFKSVFSL